MIFDPEAGLYVFEMILGLKSNGEVAYSPHVLVQADDAEEAEEKALEYLNDLDLEENFWVEEMSEAHGIEEYQQQIEESGGRPLPLLEEMSEDEFRDFLDF